MNCFIGEKKGELMDQQKEVMSSYKSLTPKDSEYKEYMMGRFSDTERAIPQISLNPQCVNEIVTFEIRKIEHLEPASLGRKVWLLLKPHTWLTVIVPFIVISRVDLSHSISTNIILLLSLISLMVYANWQADLADHLEGWDRLSGGNDKSVLQKGWFTGQQLKQWSQGILFANVVIGIPLIMNNPWVLVPYALGVLALLFLLPRWWRQSVGLGISSLCIFLLSGPLLAIGIDLAHDAQLNKNSLFLGVAWGLWMSFVRQQNVYSKQWRLFQKKSSYAFLNLGFDRAKALMRLMIVVVPGMMLFNFIFVSGGAAWFFPLLVTHSFFIFWELNYNEKVQSSIGSSLKNLHSLFRWHFYAVSIMMVIGAMIWKTTL